MEINCQNCDARLNIVSPSHLRFVTREANDIDPSTYLIVESGAAGDWLVHRCASRTGPDRSLEERMSR